MPPSHRFLAQVDEDRFELLETADIFHVEAEGGESLVRTRRARRRRVVESLGELVGRLPSPPFFRAHRSHLVNLDRVREVRRRSDGQGWELRLDPPVNTIVPLSRSRAAALFQLLGRRT
jgi:two-component system LytT family response regulator